MLAVIIIVIVILCGFAFGGLLGAPWVPAYKRDVKKILDDAQLKSGQLYVELGCGDGRLCAEASHRGASVIGYEVNPLMWLIASIRCFKYPKTKIMLASFWSKSLKDADVVFCFLMPKFMKRLETMLASELKPKAMFISYIYKLPNKKPSLARTRWYTYKF